MQWLLQWFWNHAGCSTCGHYMQHWSQTSWSRYCVQGMSWSVLGWAPYAAQFLEWSEQLPHVSCIPGPACWGQSVSVQTQGQHWGLDKRAMQITCSLWVILTPLNYMVQLHCLNCQPNGLPASIPFLWIHNQLNAFDVT